MACCTSELMSAMISRVSLAATMSNPAGCDAAFPALHIQFNTAGEKTTGFRIALRCNALVVQCDVHVFSRSSADVQAHVLGCQGPHQGAAGYHRFHVFDGGAQIQQLLLKNWYSGRGVFFGYGPCSSGADRFRQQQVDESPDTGGFIEHGHAHTGA
jgi:hypothetical protein